MKKFIISLVLFLSLSPTFCLAQTGAGDTSEKGLQSAFGGMLENVGDRGGYNTKEEVSVEDLIINIIQIVLSFIGILFVLLLIYGGFTWMTAGGRENKIDEAKKTIKQAIVGLVIIFGSYAISYFIIKAFSFLTT